MITTYKKNSGGINNHYVLVYTVNGILKIHFEEK